MNRRLTDWLDSAQGAALRHTESALLGEALEDCFGWELLQIGAWGTGRELIAKGRTRSQAVLASTPCAGVDVLTRLTQLPIASDSVDCVVLPHTLEFEADPYAVLREVDRVLAGEGKLLVLGFAPFSPWGARALASRSGFPPGLRRVLAERRLARRAAGEMARIILNTGARAHLLDHLQVITGALLKPLFLKGSHFPPVLLQPVAKFQANGFHGDPVAFIGANIMTAGINCDLIKLFQKF